MPLRRGQPVRFVPGGVCDAVDGTNAAPGAMVSLANLIPDPATTGVVVPRPAAVRVGSYDAFDATFISGLLVVGDLAYGMIASTRNPGADEPFVYDLANNLFLTVTGITAGNVPASPPASGEWVPPILAQVGTRIIVTHPGFPGGAVKFGWFDISGFTETATANVVSGSPIITGAPSILGIQPGMTVSGTAIPAGAAVLSTANFVLNTFGNTNSNTTVDSLVDTTGVAAGQAIAGTGIPIGATVVTVDSVSQVTISAAATATATGEPIHFAGTTITISADATGTHNAETITVAGGSATAPLWGAGDTDTNPLPSPPVGVAQFNGRAYYALGKDGIVYSDSGFACRVSNTLAVQALTTNDGLAVTAIAPLMLSAPLTGGIVQSLLAFEGATKMQQITGDQTTANLAMNALPVATGTLAPLSIVPCSLGTAFVSPDGLRVVQFSGAVTDPIGEAGAGIVVPFMFSVQPSRICAAASVSTLRITTQNGNDPTLPQQEWWYDIARKIWTGPHSFAASLIQPWRSTFLVSPIAVLATLFQSSAAPSLSSTYVENGQTLTWIFSPTPLPDTGAIAENKITEMNIALQVPLGLTIGLQAADFNGQVLDYTTLPPVIGAPSIWDVSLWDQAVWDGASDQFQQYPVDWNGPLVFKQLLLRATGQSAYGLRIGNVYMRYQILGYKLQVAMA